MILMHNNVLIFVQRYTRHFFG